MTSRRGMFTINLVKRDSREEAEVLLLMLQGSPVSPKETLEVLLVVETHTQEKGSRSPRLVRGEGLILSQRTRDRSLSKWRGNVGRAITSANPAQTNFSELWRTQRNERDGWNGRFQKQGSVNV